MNNKKDRGGIFEMKIEELELVTGGAYYSEEYLKYKKEQEERERVMRESGLLGVDIWTYKN